MKFEIDKNYDPKKHAERVHGLVRQTIGKGCDPCDGKVIELWQKVTDPMPPRTYMYIMSTTQDICFRSKGFSVLGLPDSWTFSWQQLLGLTHINQLKLGGYQSLILYEAFLFFKEEMHDKGIIYCNSRGVKNITTENSYFLVHQTAYPIQYDKNGYVTKYLSSCRVLGDYNGEALKTQVHTDQKFPEVQEKLRKLLSEGKKSMLNVLNFSLREQEIITLMAYTDLKTSSEIATHLGISPRTVERHRGSINYKAKQAFPLNNFSDTTDIIDYLKKQLII
ncbi:MAG: hypothetical protein Sapg2KO_24660 [Saprospiraceae bacterium]